MIRETKILTATTHCINHQRKKYVENYPSAGRWGKQKKPRKGNESHRRQAKKLHHKLKKKRREKVKREQRTEKARHVKNRSNN